MTGATVAEMRHERLQAARRDIRSGDENERACRQCGKAITTRQRRKYCSQECSVIGKREMVRQWHKKHPENIKTNNKKWQVKNTEKISEYRRKRYKDNPEKHKKIVKMWKKSNIEKTKKYNLKWRKNNPENVKEIARRSYEKRRKKAMEAAGK